MTHDITPFKGMGVTGCDGYVGPLGLKMGSLMVLHCSQKRALNKRRFRPAGAAATLARSASGAAAGASGPPRMALAKATRRLCLGAIRSSLEPEWLRYVQPVITLGAAKDLLLL
jgi:hypothetical protein